MSTEKNNVFLKIKMYILSLWLLFCFIIISVINLEELCKEVINWQALLLQNIIPLVCLTLIILCIIFYFQFRYELDGTMMTPVKVVNIRNRNSDYMAFLATHIIPLIFFDFASARQMIILILLLISIGVIYAKTDIFLSNPTFALLGYKIYEIETDKQDIYGTMISQTEITDRDNICYIRLDKRAFFIRKV